MDQAKLIAILCDIHDQIPRQGPGSTQSTLRALEMVPGLSERREVLDIGCGTGAQTMVVAAALPEARIQAVDFYPPFLEELERRAKNAGVADRVRAVVGDMAALDVPPESQDLIWAEGSVFIMGFEAGLRAWKPLLKRGGVLALSEACWLTEDRPAECLEFWAENYPSIRSVAALVEACRGEGYRVLGHFSLPAEDWSVEFYAPREQRLVSMREKYAADAEALAVVESSQDESDLYRQYAGVWGYEFLVLEPIDPPPKQ